MPPPTCAGMTSRPQSMGPMTLSGQKEHTARPAEVALLEPALAVAQQLDWVAVFEGMADEDAGGAEREEQ